MAEPPEYLSLSSVDPGTAGRPAFTIGRVFSRTLSAVGANLVPFLLITTVLMSPLVAINYATSEAAVSPKPQLNSQYGWLVASPFISLALTQFVTATLMFGVFEHLLGRSASWWDCVRRGFRRTPAALWTVFLFTLAIMGGAFFCVVPGIYVYIVYSVCVPVSILDGQGGWAAMKRSKSLTVGHGWTILASFLLVGIAGAVVTGVLGFALRREPVVRSSSLSAFQIVGTMWQSAMLCVIYHGLRATTEDLDVAEVAKVFE